jgi:hypothetical protein
MVITSFEELLLPQGFKNLAEIIHQADKFF